MGVSAISPLLYSPELHAMAVAGGRRPVAVERGRQLLLYRANSREDRSRAHTETLHDGSAVFLMAAT